MPTEGRAIDFELLKRLIEESGLNTATLLSRLASSGVLAVCDQGCMTSCISCRDGCSSGPTKGTGIEPVISPGDLEKLKRDIVAELRR